MPPNKKPERESDSSNYNNNIYLYCANISQYELVHRHRLQLDIKSSAQKQVGFGLNDDKVWVERIYAGRAFHSVGTATEKALSPHVQSLLLGTTRACVTLILNCTLVCKVPGGPWCLKAPSHLWHTMASGEFGNVSLAYWQPMKTLENWGDMIILRGKSQYSCSCILDPLQLG